MGGNGFSERSQNKIFLLDYLAGGFGRSFLVAVNGEVIIYDGDGDGA